MAPINRSRRSHSGPRPTRRSGLAGDCGLMPGTSRMRGRPGEGIVAASRYRHAISYSRSRLDPSFAASTGLAIPGSGRWPFEFARIHLAYGERSADVNWEAGDSAEDPADDGVRFAH